MGAAPYTTLRRDRKVCRFAPASLSIRCSMAGATNVVVMPSRSISRTASDATKTGMITLVSPTVKPCMNQPIPATCMPGKATRARSSGRQSIQSTPCRFMFSMNVKKARLASTAPLGRPVVPLV
jgi:hypothetical protein